MKDRYLESAIKDDLTQKMVFIAGPRQVGKTTLAKFMASLFGSSAYLNWDSREHRRTVVDSKWSPETEVLVFDELHKYRQWKSFIKGVWDTRPSNRKIMVTGSSRLDIYRRGGDSLQGRYHYYRLHPFTLKELSSRPKAPEGFPKEPPPMEFPSAPGDIGHLMAFGGFPEPCLAGSERVLRRWQKQRFERVFREDIRDSEPVRALADVEILASMLPERVASPLSLNSLAIDIEVSPKSVKAWCELLCRNYYTFRVPPYHRRIQRALRKESKYYLWDWTEVHDEGRRFENLVAAHLLKFCHYYEDVFGNNVRLFYLRDLEKREVDFLVTWEDKPWLIAECRLSPGASLTAVNYFATKLEVTHRFVVTAATGVDYVDRNTGIRILSADRFLMALL